jgi:hypothetical protein
MSIGATSSNLPPAPPPATPSAQSHGSPVQTKKNDGDGDEVNGVDPLNEKALEAAKTAAPQTSGHPKSGTVLNLFA